ncbi:MAG: response regulator [Helicobacteraceae bacterium]|nr:response regulator [Helicobacteraceae bacterium]
MSKIRIGIVDDEEKILHMIEEYLKSSGKYEVIIFSDPLEALEKIDNSFELVLCDVMMPNLGGIDLSRKLLERDEKLKIIIMTAYSTLESMLKSNRAGAVDYVMKPFESLKALEEKIALTLSL